MGGAIIALLVLLIYIITNTENNIATQTEEKNISKNKSEKEIIEEPPDYLQVTIKNYLVDWHNALGDFNFQRHINYYANNVEFFGANRTKEKIGTII